MSILPNLNAQEIIQSLIGLIMVIGTMALLLLGKGVPEFVLAADGLILGYYYGTAHTAVTVMNAVKAINGEGPKVVADLKSKGE